MSDIVKVAIIIAVGLIMSGFLFSGRYTMLLNSEAGEIWRLDRYTGKISVCGVPDNKRVAGCAPMAEGNKATLNSN